MGINSFLSKLDFPQPMTQTELSKIFPHDDNDSTKERLKDKGRALVEQGRKYFESLDKVEPIKDDWSYLSGTTDKEKIMSIFSNYSGLILGETHTHRSPKKFLIKNMNDLKESGVKVLFLEFLPYESCQDALYKGFRSNCAWLGKVKQSLKELDEQNNLSGKYTYSKVFKAARKAGIYVVCMETHSSRFAGIIDNCGKKVVIKAIADRNIGMNFAATKIINNTINNQKFIALVGLQHGSTFNIDNKEPLFGLAPLLQVPFIILADKSRKTPHAEKKESFNIANNKVKKQSQGFFGTFSYEQNYEFVNMHIENYAKKTKKQNYRFF